MENFGRVKEQKGVDKNLEPGHNQKDFQKHHAQTDSKESTRKTEL